MKFALLMTTTAAVKLTALNKAMQDDDVPYIYRDENGDIKGEAVEHTRNEWAAVAGEDGLVSFDEFVKMSNEELAEIGYTLPNWVLAEVFINTDYNGDE